jgi:hypothetical protein
MRHSGGSIAPFVTSECFAATPPKPESPIPATASTLNVSHAERGEILLGRWKLRVACLGQAQVFLGLGKVGMKT